MATFHLQIVTPDRLVFDGQVERVVARTVGGDVCILAKHIDYAAPLGIGEAHIIDENGKAHTAACSGGMIGVSSNEVRVMATTFEWEEDIDLARAEKARDEAQRKLEALTRADKEYAIVEAKLKRAVARIGVKG